MKKIVLLLISMLFVVPAFAGTKEFMAKCLDSWIGYTTNDIITVWGYPSDERTIAGKHLLYWTSSSTAYVPQSSYSNVQRMYNAANVYTQTYGGYIVTNTCNKTIEVDDNNKIISWEWTGNSCPGSYTSGKKLVNPDNDKWAIEKMLKQQIKAEKKQLKKKLKEQKALDKQSQKQDKDKQEI